MPARRMPNDCGQGFPWSRRFARVLDSDGGRPVTAAVTQGVTQDATKAAPTTNPYLGILGVFLGAGVATLNARLVSVGLPDLRGALGLSFDEGSWFPTALNMATMFAGVFVVFLSVCFGPRRILLLAASIFALTSLLLPLASSYWVMLGMLVLAGL